MKGSSMTGSGGFHGFIVNTAIKYTNQAGLSPGLLEETALRYWRILWPV
jgi:hypothetical protein